MKNNKKNGGKNWMIRLLGYCLPVIALAKAGVIGLFISLSFLPQTLLAQTMSSENFQIQGGNFNMTAGTKESDKYRLQDVVGQTAAGIFNSKGYIIQAGFLNSATEAFFSLTVSPVLVDFGSLIANNPVERSVKITVTNGSVPGYNVWVIENHPLSTTTEAQIPNTACDLDQKHPCTYLQAGSWKDISSYGLGYGLEGRTIPQGFTSIDFYRPFPAVNQGEKPVLIMSSTQEKATDQAKMTLKVNISPNQPVGQYSNIINFSAAAGI